MPTLKKTVLAFGVMTAVVATVTTVSIPAPGLSDEVARHARDRWSLALSSEGSGFSLLRGTTLTGVSVGLTSSRLVLDGRVETVVLHHRLSLGGALSVPRITVVRPRLRLTVGQSLSPPEEPAQGLASDTEYPSNSVSSSEAEPGPRSHIEFQRPRVEIEDATVLVETMSEDAYSLRALGLSARLSDGRPQGALESRAATASVGGSFVADTLELGRLQVSEARGDLALEEDGYVRVTDLRFRCGDVRLFLPELDIDFTQDPFALITRSSVFEDVSPTDSGPSRTPVASFAELDRLCR